MITFDENDLRQKRIQFEKEEAENAQATNETE